MQQGTPHLTICKKWLISVSAFAKIQVFVQLNYNIKLKLWSLYGDLKHGVEICQETESKKLKYCLILNDDEIQAIAMDYLKEYYITYQSTEWNSSGIPLPSEYVCEPKYSTWNLRPLFSSRNTIYKYIGGIDNRLGSMEYERTVEKSIGITTTKETRLSIGVMAKAGINLDWASEDNKSGKNAESRMTLGYEENYAETRETMMKQKDVFRVSPGENFWICQKIEILNYWPNNEEIEIATETIWVKGDC